MISASALLGASTAYAQPTPPLTLTGNVTVQKGTGPVLTCTISFIFAWGPPGIVAASIDIDPGDAGCTTFEFVPGLYAVDYDPGAWPSGFTVKNTLISASGGYCGGDVTATHIGPAVWTISETVAGIPPASGDCIIAGFVS